MGHNRTSCFVHHWTVHLRSRQRHKWSANHDLDIGAELWDQHLQPTYAKCAFADAPLVRAIQSLGQRESPTGNAGDQPVNKQRALLLNQPTPGNIAWIDDVLIGGTQRSCVWMIASFEP
jgi:hypothetical protein